jgi:LytS/YehU family sensor histidine kinase
MGGMTSMRRIGREQLQAMKISTILEIVLFAMLERQLLKKRRPNTNLS